jgi:hypothetical protein
MCYSTRSVTYSVRKFAYPLSSSKMPFPPPEETTPSEFASILERLKVLLENLPNQLPAPKEAASKYRSFLSFSLDPELLEKTGDEVAAMGEQLERVFGWQARTTGDGILPITERGKPICALHGILSTYHAKNLNNNVLKKWVIDVAIGAEKVFNVYDVPVRHSLHTHQRSRNTHPLQVAGSLQPF